jgi:single-stranded-DNA-specific exonuclease
MTQHSQRWIVAERLSPEADLALREYPPIFRQILANRGYTTFSSADQYLKAEIPKDGDAPAMLGISEAVDRIRFAIRTHQPIAIYGDYDVDGVTATALLTHLLKELGADVRGYIPNRFDEGYGLNNEALQALYDSGVRLVITVDCGVRSLPEAEYAAHIGLDMIITDHHHPADELPQAVAIINPKQPADPYPEKNLAGVGLAYKLGCALAAGHDLQVESYLDLVALGTVADLAPLRGENRALVRSGLNLLRRPHRQGVLSLISAAGLKVADLTAHQIGFTLGPRLNAAGRLDSALAALDLLLTDDLQTAGRLAQQLDDQNRERQALTREIQELAEKHAWDETNPGWLLFAADPAFNPGVVGLAASRLSERHYRPAIVAHQGEQVTRASCRSIPEFHITDALDECAELMEHHGGHAAAAGFTVRNERLPELIQRMQEIAARQLSGVDLRRSLHADIELPLSDLKPYIIDYLKWLEPTGQENATARFVSRKLKVSRAYTVGREGNHLRLEVSDGMITYSAIAFHQGDRLDVLPKRIDLMYQYELNQYNGRSTLQLNVIDMKNSSLPDD